MSDGVIDYDMVIGHLEDEVKSLKARAERDAETFRFKMETQASMTARTADLLIEKQNELATVSIKLKMCREFINQLLDKFSSND